MITIVAIEYLYRVVEKISPIYEVSSFKAYCPKAERTVVKVHNNKFGRISF